MHATFARVRSFHRALSTSSARRPRMRARSESCAADITWAWAPHMSPATRARDATGSGYNGTAKGFPHDDCKFDQPGNCLCVHAEQNALIKVRVNDPRKVVFVTGQPCVTCAKLIINSGASKVYYRSAYRSDEGLELFKKAGIEIERV